MLIGPLILAAAGLLAGILPFLFSPLVSAASTTIVGYPIDPVVKLWAGFNLPLLLSAVTLVVGLLIFRFREHIATLQKKITPPGAEAAYDAIFKGVLSFAHWQTRTLQSGYLRNYLLIIIAATGALIFSKLFRFGGITDFTIVNSITPTGTVIVTIMIAATILAVVSKSRLTALIALGTVGYGVALIFAIFSAPDLAITQILVETLTVVLFAWVVHKLPEYRELSSRRSKLFDASVAALSGIVVTVLVLKSKSVSLGERMSDTLTDMSYPLAHGANVVNVILVDFRALDTWGEICVLAIASIGVWSLLGKRFVKTDP